MTLVPPAPAAIIDLVKCNCKKGCSKGCSCRKELLGCTEMCGCINFDCHNPFSVALDDGRSRVDDNDED